MPPTALESGQRFAEEVLSRTSATVQMPGTASGLPVNPGGSSVKRSRRLWTGTTPVGAQAGGESQSAGGGEGVAAGGGVGGGAFCFGRRAGADFGWAGGGAEQAPALSAVSPNGVAGPKP